jgi:intracellular multiplication protein IcmK
MEFAIMSLRRFLLLPVLSFVTVVANAATIHNISFSPVANNGLEVRLDFDTKPSADPKGYTTDSPARIMLDFDGVDSALSEKNYTLSGLVDSANVLSDGNKTRLVLNTKQLETYKTRFEGNSFIVTVGKVPVQPVTATNVSAAMPMQTSPEAAQKQPPNALGQQADEAPPIDVVYPTPRTVVSETVNEAMELQLTPSEIQSIKEKRLERERQLATPYNMIAKPITRTIFVDLTSGAQPPVLRLTKGQQSSIVFTDVDGNPWMIDRVSFNHELFSDGRTEAAAKDSPATNILTLEAMRAVAYGNVTVTLQKLHVPVIFVLTTDQPEVDIRIDAKIDGMNPNAPPVQMTSSGMPNIDNDLGGFLDGVPPKEAKTLKVTGIEETQAWRLNNNIYVRTRGGAPLYPAYIASTRATSGASALAVYKFQTSGLNELPITFSNNGVVQTAFIKE